jgi:hypothetical protein
MHSPLVSQIEVSINQLPLVEQLRLIERITQHIRETMVVRKPLEYQLETMAADPEIQNELQNIHKEFSIAETDGLAKL